MNVTDYVVVLDNDARYRVRFETAMGNVTEFLVQLEYHASTAWLPVVRYDTAHDFPHCDRYGPNGIVSQHEPMQIADHGKAMNAAIFTIQGDWQALIAPFRESKP